MWLCSFSFWAFPKAAVECSNSTDTDVCLRKSVWRSAVDYITPFYCRLLSRCVSLQKKNRFSLLSFLCIYHLNFSEFQKGCKQQRKGQLCLSFSSMQLLPSVPVQCQLLPVTGVKTESQSFSGRWLFSEFIFVVGLRMWCQFWVWRPQTSRKEIELACLGNHEIFSERASYLKLKLKLKRYL